MVKFESVQHAINGLRKRCIKNLSIEYVDAEIRGHVIRFAVEPVNLFCNSVGKRRFHVFSNGLESCSRCGIVRELVDTDPSAILVRIESRSSIEGRKFFNYRRQS